jgi:hypothetical protein
MSTSIGGKIVTDGLMLHLDALNPASYPGSGTDWFSLRPNIDYTIDLANGTNPATIANGYATFDPANESKAYIGAVVLNRFTPNVTIDFWAKIKPFVGSSIRRILSIGVNNGFYIGYLDNLAIGIGTNSTNLWGVSGLTVQSLGAYNAWAHFSCVLSNGVTSPGYPNLPKESQKVYINGNLPTQSDQTGDDNGYGNQRSWGSTDSVFFFVGGPLLSSALIWGDFEIASVKAYNRELTQDEVTQNFNAHKGRFNIY